MPVRYPAFFKTLGIVASRSDSCSVNPPFASPYWPLLCGYKPVNIPLREGLHEACTTYAVVKRTPLAANLSRFGVAIRFSP